MSDYTANEYGIFVIDPESCGCTECIIGEYHPRTDEVMLEAARLHFEENVPVYSNDGTLVLLAHTNGSYGFVEAPGGADSVAVVNREDVNPVVFRALAASGTDVDADEPGIALLVTEYRYGTEEVRSIPATYKAAVISR